VLVFETAVRKDERLYLAPARCMRFVLVADLPYGALSAREGVITSEPSRDDVSRRRKSSSDHLANREGVIVFVSRGDGSS